MSLNQALLKRNRPSIYDVHTDRGRGINFFSMHINRSFNVHIFSLFVIDLQLDVISPLLLNASLLLVLTTDYSD